MKYFSTKIFVFDFLSNFFFIIMIIFIYVVVIIIIHKPGYHFLLKIKTFDEFILLHFYYLFINFAWDPTLSISFYYKILIIPIYI